MKVFGSYMLGVHFPDTGIDLILIFRSKYITQVDFFTDFVKSISTEPFNNICEIESARVPIIKFSLYDVQFDVLFAAVDDFKFVKRVLSGKSISDSTSRE